MRWWTGKAFFAGAFLSAGCFAIQQESVGRIVCLLFGLVVGFFGGVKMEDRFDLLQQDDYRRRHGRGK